MQRSKRLAWLLLAGGTAVLLGLGWWEWSPVEPGGVAPAMPEGRISVAPKTAERVQQGEHAQPGVASPSEAQDGVATENEKPLNLARDFAELATRAELGDRRSACLLGRGLSKCRGLAATKQARADVRRRLEESAPGSEAESRLLDEVVMHEDRIRGISDLCEGLEKVHIDNAWRFMLRASELGDHRTAVAFLTAPPLDPDNVLQDIEGWREYRERFWTLLQASVNAGNVEALNLAYGVISGQDSVLGMRDPIVAPDPSVALEYALVLQRVLEPRLADRMGHQVVDLSARVTPEIAIASAQRAETLYNDHFAQAPLYNPYQPAPDASLEEACD